MNFCPYCGKKYSYIHPWKCKIGKRVRKNFYNYCLEIAEEFNIPISVSDDVFRYDGKAIPIPSHYLSDTFFTVHEMAHWLYASPEERLDPGFKLGPNDNEREKKVLKIQRLIEDQYGSDLINQTIDLIRKCENVF